MSMHATHTEWTAVMVRALPDDGRRYEVVDGELLVTPAPQLLHQRAAFLFAQRLAGWLGQRRIGEVFMSPADIEFSSRRLVQPDVFVAPLVAGRLPATWRDIRTLVLAAEILSPSSARADRQVKRRLYQTQRVPEYWIVDIDAHLVERWRPDDVRPEIVAERLEWAPADGCEALQLDLAAYFREVRGEKG